MHRPLFHLTRLGIAVVGAAGIAAAVLHQPPADRGLAADDPIVPASVASAPDDPPTTTTAAPTTTTAPTTTVAPTTTAPTNTTTTTSAPVPPPPPLPAAPPPPQPSPTSTAPAPAPATAPSTQRTSACESQLFDLMNRARGDAGRPAIGYDPAILSIARDWSATMAQRQDLQHNPDVGPQVFRAQPAAMRVAENVGRTTDSVASLHRAFMDSSSHRANILSASYSHAAIGCVTDGSGQIWATVDFWGG